MVTSDDPVVATKMEGESRKILDIIDKMDFPLDWVRIPEMIRFSDHQNKSLR